MKFGTQNHNRGLDASSRAARRRLHAFTLAEVLAAMLFLAIVFPTMVEALHIASLAGEVAVRKGAAARVADRILNESIVTTNWNGGVMNGTISEGSLDFDWSLSVQSWPQNAAQLPSSIQNLPVNGLQPMTVQNMPRGVMEMLTAEVKFQAQGKVYTVTLGTLGSPLNRTAGTTGM